MTPLPDPQDVTRFRTLLTDFLGFQFDDSKLNNLAKLLHHRAAIKKLPCRQYLDQLAVARKASDELHCLARELTITETYFLRNVDQFHAFTEIVLPEHLAVCENVRQVRVLSAGCASGDEPYSLAIAIREQFPHVADRISITALDINSGMLEKAALGRYSNWSLRDFPAHLRTRWFKQQDNGFVLDAAIRNAVRFEQRNLAQDNPDFWLPSCFDVVFCRNVLMYFTSDKARAAIDRIANALSPGGYLFIGHAETLRGLSNDFHLCHTHGTFYYRRKDNLSERYQTAPAQPALRAPTAALGDTSWIAAIQHATDRIDALAHGSAARIARSIAERTCTIERIAPDLRRALEYLHSERFDQTLEQIGSLPAEHALDPDVLLLKAVSLSHSGAFDDAESACRELLACDELNAGAHYVLALCRESIGDVQGAIDHDQTAVYLDPDFAMPHLHIGLLTRRQRGESARNELERALLLLQKEDASRLLLFGGGFKREALTALCKAELAALERAA